MSDTVEAHTFDLSTLYQDIQEQLRQAELRAAELRGQLRLIEQLIQETRMRRNGDDLGEQQP